MSENNDKSLFNINDQSSKTSEFGEYVMNINLAASSYQNSDIREELTSLLSKLYQDIDIKELADKIINLIKDKEKEKSKEIREWDKAQKVNWYKNSDNAAYVLYADLFTPEAPEGKHLQAMTDANSLDYIKELGVNIIHILPILKSTGDGGFAVQDYHKVDEKFGTTDDLKVLIKKYHDNGIYVTLDFVLNHVADEHLWAMEAKKDKSSKYHDYFIWSDSGIPWPGVPDVFPDLAPGHWDFVPELNQWVWATFYKRHPYGCDPKEAKSTFAQWDLNYHNPDVLLDMLENLLNMANWGVDIFRLDAAVFMWKEKGTECISLPQVFILQRLFRLVVEALAPHTIFLAEGVDKFSALMNYFGGGKGVHTMYHFPLMPPLWQSLITGDATVIKDELIKVPRVLDYDFWWVFSESHDDLTLEEVTKPTAEIISKYFLDSGCLPFKQLKGEDHPSGICGTTFSLLRGDTRKILLLWNLKLSLGWTPLFYMGEELGVENDMSFLNDPEKSKDNRFVKRIKLTPEKKNNRSRLGNISGYLFNNLKNMIKWRKAHPCLVLYPDFFDTGSNSVLGFSKQDENERMIILANCSDITQSVSIVGLGTRVLNAYEFYFEVTDTI